MFDPRPRVPPALQKQEQRDVGPLLKVTNYRQGAILMSHHGVPDFAPGVTLVPLGLLNELDENVQDQIRDHVAEGWLHFAAYDPSAEAQQQQLDLTLQRPVPVAPDPRALPADEPLALAAVASCMDPALLDYWFKTPGVVRSARVSEAIASRQDALVKR